MATQEIDFPLKRSWFEGTFESTFGKGLILAEERRRKETNPQPQFYPYNKLEMPGLAEANAKANERAFKRRTRFSSTYQPKRTSRK